jgi:hypothetical protein
MKRESQKNGLRFQAVVEKVCTNPGSEAYRFAQSFDQVLCGPWIYYTDANNTARFSQPDILLFDHSAKRLLILECKLQHTRYAWGQYKHYQALLSLMYPQYNICGIEVCKSIDPMESYSVVLTEIRPHTYDFASYLWLPK